MKKVLVLIEDAYVRQFACAGLRREYVVMEAADCSEALEMLASDEQIICVVVDVALSQQPASVACDRIRQAFGHLRILLLTEKEYQVEAVTALMSGADDQLDKPFSHAKILAKVHYLADREKTEDAVYEQLLSSGPFILNNGTGVLQKMEKPIPLTRNEYSLMRMFLAHPGRTYTTEELDDLVWGDGQLDAKRLSALVRRLRLKIEDDPKNPTFITTVWGYGYEWR